MGQDKYAVELENVSKVLKNKEVLSNITVPFQVGKIHGIIGTNGSGKTMLLRTIAGLLYIRKGTVKYMNPTMTRGVIIENPGFLTSYTGYENLQMLAAIRHTIGSEEIREAMCKVGLDPKDKRKVKEYSLGMKQRLAIAQAIMEDPDMLILDEPFRGLDTDGVKTIRALLIRYNQSGRTVFIASHNTEDIELLCHHVYEMYGGKLRQVK